MENKSYVNRKGQRFGQLTVIKHVGFNKYDRPKWRCFCSCGAKLTVVEDNFVEGFVDRCNACYLKLYASFDIPMNTAETSLHTALKETCFSAWYNMVHKCLSYSRYSKPFYKDQGITVSERWRKFENFYKDMAPQPSGFVLSRIDKEASYSKENCKWMSTTETMIGRSLGRMSGGPIGRAVQLKIEDKPKVTPEVIHQVPQADRLKKMKEEAEAEIAKGCQARTRLEKIESALKALDELGYF